MNIIYNIRDGWDEMVMKLQPILQVASNRGIPIDFEELDRLVIYLENERLRIYNSMQAKIPDEIRNIYPTEGYVRIPKLIQELGEIYQDKITKIILKENQKLIPLSDFIAKKSYHQIIKAGENTKTWGRYKYGLFDVMNKKSAEITRVGRWCLVKDFNPNSSKQLISYMKFKKHKIPIKLTGEETSDVKELERLAINTKDSFYDETIEYRQVSKMLTNDCPNWIPNEKTGAVHTEFGFLPASGQLNSRNPNTQNVNKHKALGKRFRRIVRARDNRGRGELGGLELSSRRRVLVELDYSGFHAVMLGREAKSERYINISRSDPHSWFTSYIVNKPIEYPKDFETNLDAANSFRSKLRIIKEEYKVIRDTQSKPSILAIGLGLGHKKLYWMNRTKLDRKSNQIVGIESESKAKQLQSMLKELLPELFIYQELIKELAFRQTYLINKWGMIRWFFDVRGEDGERAIAFNVQGNAHGMLRWVIRENEDKGYNEKYSFINTIHDSLVFEPWEDEMEECISNVSKVMETPCLVLADKKVCPGGLVIKVEASWGRNWAEYDEKDNIDGMRLWKLG